MFGCQPILLESSPVLEFICSEVNKLANCGIYYARQLLFKTGSYINKYSLAYEYKSNKHYQALYSQAAQQTLFAVWESFQSYRELLELWQNKPKLPTYRTKGGLAVVSYPKQALKLVDGKIRLPLGQLVKTWFKLDSFTIPMPSNLKFKAARIVLNHCLEHGIGTVVFGWNKDQRQQCNMGAKTNQMFVQIPTARLKERIAQLCEQYGIQFVETEESYTSQASFLDNDFLPTFGEKPDSWKSSGKKTKRGLFRTALNWYINADCNGAANILRKVSTTLGLDLSGVSRGALTRPQRIRLWSAKRKVKGCPVTSV